MVCNWLAGHRSCASCESFEVAVSAGCHPVSDFEFGFPAHVPVTLVCKV